MTGEDIRCCQEMLAAQESGTGGDGYGTFLFVASGSEGLGFRAGDLVGGYGLPPVKFCPWCGTEVESHGSA